MSTIPSGPQIALRAAAAVAAVALTAACASYGNDPAGTYVFCLDRGHSPEVCAPILEASEGPA